MNLSTWLEEVRRRRVIRAMVGWGLFSFAALQVVEPVQHALGLADWALKVVVAVLALGFPVTAGLAWAFDLTRKGIERTAPAVGTTPEAATRLASARPAVVLVLVGALIGAGVAGFAGWHLWGRVPAPGPDGRITVAVADFVNDTGERELDALSGLLITSLEQSKRLSVLTRTMMLDLARQAGHADVDLIDERLGHEVARRARAQALLVAAVHRFDQSYAIELKAIDPKRDAYLFTLLEKADGRAAIPDAIDRLGEQTRRRLHEPEGDVAAARVRVAEAVTGSLEAFEHYFRGVQLQETTRYEHAIKEYRAATRIDPTFASAHYRIAYAGFFHGLPAPETRSAIEAAMRHGGRVPAKERQLIMGWDARLNGRNEEAERIYARAAAAYPDDKQVSFMAGEHLIHWGKFAESLPHFERAVALDPTWEWARFHVVDDLLALGRFGEALDRAQRWVHEKPDSDTWRWLSRALTASGKFSEAAEAGRRSMGEHSGPWNFPDYWSRLAIVDALLRLERFSDAEEVLHPVVAGSAPASDRARGLYALAEVLSYQGRRREALRVIDSLQFEGASVENRLGLRIQQFLGSGMPIRREVQEALRAGIPGGQLATWTAMSGDLPGAARLAEGLESGSPERELYEAVASWRHGDRPGARGRFSALATQPALDYAAFALFALGEISVEEGRDAEAVSFLEAFAGTPVVSWRWGVPPAEVYRWFFAGSFRSWAYPRSLYLVAVSQDRLGRREEARAAAGRLISIWSKADPDLPLLSEARALCRKLGCKAPK